MLPNIIAIKLKRKASHLPKIKLPARVTIIAGICNIVVCKICRIIKIKQLNIPPCSTIFLILSRIGDKSQQKTRFWTKKRKRMIFFTVVRMP